MERGDLNKIMTFTKENFEDFTEDISQLIKDCETAKFFDNEYIEIKIADLGRTVSKLTTLTCFLAKKLRETVEEFEAYKIEKQQWYEHIRRGIGGKEVNK